MEELLAKLRELQQQQQELNGQMAAKQSSKPADSPAGQASSNGEPSQSQGDGSSEAEGKATGGTGQPTASDAARIAAQRAGSANQGSSLSSEQDDLGQRTTEAAEQVADLPIEVKKSKQKDSVATELRRAAEFQEVAASSIASQQFGDALISGGEGAASIAEAIAQLEDLVAVGNGAGNEADSFPPGYEKLIQEYLRAISYE